MSKNRISDNAGFVDSTKLPRGPNGRALCRWCQTEVPKGKRTFCSDPCIHEHKIRSSTSYARDEVFKRDKGVCVMCNLDTTALLAPKDPTYLEAVKQAAGARSAHDAARDAWWVAHQKFGQDDTETKKLWAALNRAEAVHREADHSARMHPALSWQSRDALRKSLAADGWDMHRKTQWDMDHIIPVVEGGGACGLDNLRTLCAKCHKKVTADLRKRLAKSKAK